jgi:hypothetical protein
LSLYVICKKIKLIFLKLNKLYYICILKDSMSTEEIIKKAVEDISKQEENPWTRITRDNCHQIPFGRILINDGTGSWFAYLEEVTIKQSDYNVTFIVAKSDKVEKVSIGDYPLYWMLAPKGPERYKIDNV